MPKSLPLFQSCVTVLSLQLGPVIVNEEDMLVCQGSVVTQIITGILWFSDY